MVSSASLVLPFGRIWEAIFLQPKEAAEKSAKPLMVEKPHVKNQC